jgi:hypothetical protein
LVNELATDDADRLAVAEIRDPLVYMAMDSPPARPEDRERYQDFLSLHRPWWKKLLRLKGTAPRRR